MNYLFIFYLFLFITFIPLFNFFGITFKFTSLFSLWLFVILRLGKWLEPIFDGSFIQPLINLVFNHIGDETTRVKVLAIGDNLIILLILHFD